MLHLLKTTISRFCRLKEPICTTIQFQFQGFHSKAPRGTSTLTAQKKASRRGQRKKMFEEKGSTGKDPKKRILMSKDIVKKAPAAGLPKKKVFTIAIQIPTLLSRSIYTHTVQPTPKKKDIAVPPVEVIQSTTPTVYVCPPLDRQIDYSLWARKADYLFNLKHEYVSPIALDYKLPEDGKPEFAFIGRSNVGKSSLIGALLGTPNLIRISRAPGCTRNVNYFKAGNKKGSAECFFVDLPGCYFTISHAFYPRIDKSYAASP